MGSEDKQETILIVDDTPANIRILAEALNNDYRLMIARSGLDALETLKGDHLPDIILLDIMMPEMDGMEVLEQIKAGETTKGIPVIFITAMNEEQDEAKGLALGAVDYITKPFSLSIVKARLKTHLNLRKYQTSLEEIVQQRTEEVVETQLEIVQRLARAAEYRDNETGMHIKRISHTTALMAEKYGLDSDTCELIFHSSSMHDVGKIGVPDNILLKPGKLTVEEFNIMKTHAAIGAEMLGGHNSTLLQTATQIAATHHEKWNGTGYPNRLKGEEIVIGGRITAICDVFDALTSERPYKKAWPAEMALAEINEQKGGHFDPDLVDLFNSLFDEILIINKKLAD